VPDLSWCFVPPELVESDRALVREVDAAVGEGERRASAHFACRPGCTPCCIGPFDITVMDAARLTAGLAELSRVDPVRAAAVQGRAETAWKQLVSSFPGDTASGVLNDDDMARESFFERHSALPCPALDPLSGWCDLYSWRPLSCRTFGGPMRAGDVLLPPCELCFRKASPAEIQAATVEPDPGDREGWLLAELARLGGVPCDTVVAAVLALRSDRGVP
jgi:Fe-S-cluster containining protein